MDATFLCSFNETMKLLATGDIAIMVCRPKGPQGHLNRVCEMLMDAPFHGSFNDTIDGRVRPQRPEISLSSHGGIGSQFCRNNRPLSLILVRKNQIA
jgi:hypothetical protein